MAVVARISSRLTSWGWSVQAVCRTSTDGNAEPYDDEIRDRIERLGRAVRRQTLGFMENKTGGNIHPDLNAHKFLRESDEKPLKLKGRTPCRRIRYPNLHCQVKTTSALLCATILRRQR